jgi:hypothetical protein
VERNWHIYHINEPRHENNTITAIKPQSCNQELNLMIILFVDLYLPLLIQVSVVHFSQHAGVFELKSYAIPQVFTVLNKMVSICLFTL